MHTTSEFTNAAGRKAPTLSHQADPEKTRKSPYLSGKRVVIVEDEGITVLQLRKALQRAGLVVVGIANNGQDGVEVVLREHPDLVLMDINMPVMDGLEAATRILAELRVCIVMVTANDKADFREKTEQIGVCGYVVKPVISETLLRPLEEALRAFN